MASKLTDVITGMAGSGPMTHFRSFWLGIVLALGTAGAVHAQEPQTIGRNSDWIAYTYKSGGKTVCYMASTPLKAEGNYSKRGEIHAMVTHRPGENRIDEVSIQAGYTYKETVPVEVQVGSLKVRLFTEGESAWTVDKDTDKQLVQAMIKGNTMVVQGTSARGTNTKDTYSLSGFTRAYKAISTACGL